MICAITFTRSIIPSSSCAALLSVKCAGQTKSYFKSIQNDCKSTNANGTLAESQWKTIYKFPSIKYLRFISRFKLYQISLMLGFSYPLYMQYSQDLITESHFYSALGGCVGTTAAFLIFSYFSMKVAGQISVDKANRMKISKLSFNGTRCEDIIHLNAIVPYMDWSTKDNSNNLFQCFKVETDEEKGKYYYYSLKYGHVLNEDFYKFVGIS